ncbi:retinol dehydrogenase 7-like isoform X2 [Ambystoma mexicanum]|uniref:retinol dehydrogenase 7-like isoform X2 n=1 Tax=Ambystoma mexicanum TaxID=8296 RepID=UPI0037E9A74A
MESSTSTSFVSMPLPACLWTVNDNDVGVLQEEPVNITLKPGLSLPRIPQYKISVEVKDLDPTMWLYLAALLGLYLLFRWYRECQTVPNLHDKYVLITGCDSGFGNLLARHLDQRGMRVLAACLTQKGAERLKEETSVRLQTFIVDITNSDRVAAMAQWTKQQLADKGLWGLVNNAGVGFPMAPTEWLTKDDFAQVINVNLLGTIDVTVNLLPLVRHAQGRIVNVSSGLGRIALTGGGYCPSKYGVEAFSDSLRRDLQEFGVKVSIVEPGCFNTGVSTRPIVERSLQPLWARLPKEVKESYGEQFFNIYCKNLVDLSTTGSNNLNLVVDAIQHGITAVHPRTRYSPGWDCKFFYIPFSYFPSILVDYVLARSSPRPAMSSHTHLASWEKADSIVTCGQECRRYYNSGREQ